MGERSAPESVDAAAVERLPRAPLIALALGVALLLAVFGRPALDLDSGITILAARSLVGDGDRLWGASDDVRLAELIQHESFGVGRALVLSEVREAGDGLPFGRPLLYVLFLAPWVALAGTGGSRSGHGLVFWLWA